MTFFNRAVDLFLQFRAVTINRMVSSSEMEKDSLFYWRVKILFAILFTALVLSTVAILFSISLVIREREWGLVVSHILGYSMCLSFLFLRSIRYEIRAGVTVLMFYVVGLEVTVSFGLLSGGPAWLFAFAVLAGVLLGTRAALGAIGLNAITLTVMAWLMSTGRFGQDFPFFTSSQAMIAAGVNYIVLNVIAAVSVSVLVKGLVSSHRKEKMLTDSLEQEQKRLIEAKKRLELEVEERKQAGVALRQSEEKYRQLSDLLPQVVFETDEEGRLTFVNQVAFDLFGYTKEDLSNGFNTLEVLIPEDRDRAKKNIQRVLMGENIGGTEYTAHRKNGDIFPVLVYATSIIVDGRAAGLRGIIADLSEVKRAQEALRESEERLARLQKMESLGLMAGGIAHDLNNILSGIVTYPELLLMDLPEDSPLRKPIETIKESGQRAADVVADLLVIARGVATSTEVLNLNVVLQEYLRSAEHAKLERMRPSTNFRVELEPGLLNIEGSPTHIKKALMNLVLNAAEAIEKEGTVTLSTRNRYLDRPLEGYEDVRIGEYVLLSVSDNGGGISREEREKIFEPFYSRKEMGRSGTGLGLSVVWNTVQDQDGYIEVKSDAEGTTFELYFPVTRKESSAGKRQVPVETYLGHGERILVVDDEESQREIAVRLLTWLGYTSHAVSSGEEAIEYLRSHSVDLILLDMIMNNGINGRETYEEIVKMHPNQKAVIASGFSESEDVKAAQRLGAGKYIKKPYTLEKLGLDIKEELAK